MIPNTTTRVAEHTKEEINNQIRKKTETNIKAYGANPELIESRLKELEEEWDIERVLEANGSTLLLIGLSLGVFVNRRWLLLPMFVGGFCLQHAIQGWCPPVEAFRRMGVRTAKEINEEATTLRALRGDFKDAPS